jgi:ankyrin repeat protein
LLKDVAVSPWSPKYANDKKNFDRFETLLAQGVNPNTTLEDGQTPLECAVTYNNRNLMEKLRKHGAETSPAFLSKKLNNIKDIFDHYSKKKNQNNEMSQIENACKNLDFLRHEYLTPNTPRDDKAIFEALTSQCMLLPYAIQNKDGAMVELARAWWPAEDDAIWPAEQGSFMKKKIRKIFEEDFVPDRNFLNQVLWDAFQCGLSMNNGHTSFFSNNIYHLEIMLIAGANPNISIRDDETPLIHGIKTANVALVKLLMKHGANVDYLPSLDTMFQTLNQELYETKLLDGQFPIQQLTTKILKDYGYFSGKDHAASHEIYKLLVSQPSILSNIVNTFLVNNSISVDYKNITMDISEIFSNPEVPCPPLITPLIEIMLPQEVVEGVYDQLHCEIKKAHTLAAQASKPLMILVAEDHFHVCAQMLERMILNIAHDNFNIQTVMYELHQDVLTSYKKKEPSVREGRSLDSWLTFHDIYQFTTQHSMTLLPIDNSSYASWIKERNPLSQSEVGIKDRNKGMHETAREHKIDNVCFIGASHSYELLEPLQEDFFVLPLNVTQFLKTEEVWADKEKQNSYECQCRAYFMKSPLVSKLNLINKTSAVGQCLRNLDQLFSSGTSILSPLVTLELADKVHAKRSRP